MLTTKFDRIKQSTFGLLFLDIWLPIIRISILHPSILDHEDDYIKLNSHMDMGWWCLLVVVESVAPVGRSLPIGCCSALISDRMSFVTAASSFLYSRICRVFRQHLSKQTWSKFSNVPLEGLIRWSLRVSIDPTLHCNEGSAVLLLSLKSYIGFPLNWAEIFD